MGCFEIEKILLVKDPPPTPSQEGDLANQRFNLIITIAS